MPAKATGAKTRTVLGKRITEAQWFNLPEDQRAILVLAERMTANNAISRSDRSLIGSELGKDRFPSREDYVTWLKVPGNVARGEAMINKWFKRWR